MKTERSTASGLAERVERLMSLGLLSNNNRPLTLESLDQVCDLAEEIADQLEKSHRDAIAIRIQLLCVQEMAQSILVTANVDSAVEAVCSLLLKVFGFDQVALLLLDTESLELKGKWAYRTEDSSAFIPLTVYPLIDEGLIAKALFKPSCALFKQPANALFTGAPFGTASHPEVPHSFGLLPLVRMRSELGCWEEKQCKESACPAYGKTGQRCWQAGSANCWHEKGFQVSRNAEFCLRCSRSCSGLSTNAISF